MTEAMARYDFRQPRRLADDVQQLLVAWQEEITKRAVERWTEHLAESMPWTAHLPVVVQGGDLAARLPEAALAYRIEVGPAQWPMVLVISRPLLLGLVASMLGEAISSLPADRSLTDVETSLAELMVQEFVQALNDSQPWSASLSCQLQDTLRLQDLPRLFPAQDPVVVAGFEIDAPFGASPFHWLLSQTATLGMATHVSELRNAVRKTPAGLSQAVRRIPVEVVVRLGQARLHVSDLANLQAGDVILLDQRVSEPLTAEVAGTCKFRGWPGRVGPKQAFQITTLVDPTDET